MKKRCFALAGAILITGAVLYIWGAVIKYGILRPVGLGKDIGTIAAPFVYLTDDALRKSAKDLAEAQTPSKSPAVSSAESTPSKAPEPVVPSSAPQSSSAPPATSASPSSPAPPASSAPPAVNPYPQAPLSADGVPVKWYNETLFIGESRTEGLKVYARSGNAEYFSKVSMSVYNYDNGNFNCGDKNFPVQSLDSLLKTRKYRHIIVQLGINECGYGRESLKKQYKSLVDKIRSYQPGAKIILQGIIAVAKKALAKRPDTFKPQNIDAVNKQVIASLANGTDIFYIDVNYAFTDETGMLRDEYSPTDGIHFTPDAAKKWASEIGRCIAAQNIE